MHLAATDKLLTCGGSSSRAPTCVSTPNETGPQEADPLTPSASILPLLNLSSTSSSELLIVEGRLGTLAVRVLIDGGAKGNFVNEETRKKAGLPLPLVDPQPLTVADGRTIQCYNTPNCTLSINGLDMTLDLLAAPLAYDVILGKSWLSTLQPLNRLAEEHPHFHLTFWPSPSVERFRGTVNGRATLDFQTVHKAAKTEGYQSLLLFHQGP